ncbi:MAG: decarboxylating 6-phosphogluconate dehydrogenase [Gammaproteobacteria bacterium]|nr:decarboxylating 6-phosphogluconate dehydrogenase [Gammaproteobacteria bacterium]
MRLAMIGLGKMGANMTRRLCKAGIEVVGFNRSPEIRDELAKEVGMIPAPTLVGALAKLEKPRIVWVMLPSGKPTEKAIKDLEDRLSSGDIVIDGGNSNYKDSQRRGAMLAQSGIGYVDVGTSGGIWGLQNGYCLMIGGEKQHVDPLRPLFEALAPGKDRGWLHVGRSGAGHFTKMIHNGIEYGMMQALAEGFALMQAKEDFHIDLAQLAETWRHGSVISSWLLDLTAGALQKDQVLTAIDPHVADSGEGRWTVMESIDLGIPAPVISLALQMRFDSQRPASYSNKMLSIMRNAFGGHDIKAAGQDTQQG